MPFTDNEVRAMQGIFCQMEPKTQESIQHFTAGKIKWIQFTFGIYKKRNQYTQIFQYFYKLSPYRRKLLDKKSANLPYPLFIVEYDYGYICVGWKCQ